VFEDHLRKRDEWRGVTGNREVREGADSFVIKPNFKTPFKNFSVR
jgi:hypothetical protein